MALKIRLARYGAIHNPVYRVVISEARSRRDGRAVEQIGTYQPKISDTPLKLRLDRVDYWLSKGALPTDTMKSLIKRARRSRPAKAAPEEAAPEAEATPEPAAVAVEQSADAPVAEN